MAPAAWSWEASGASLPAAFDVRGHPPASFLATLRPGLSAADGHLVGNLGKVAGAIGSPLSKAAASVTAKVESAVGGGLKALGLQGGEKLDTKDEEAVPCSWEDMKLGNQTFIWKPEKADIQYSYHHDLKGQEIKVWWPGKAAGGECSNVKDSNRGCWYTARMLNDPGCQESDHCLHVAAHDGEPRHTFTCPTYIRNSEGRACKLPQNWQDCPPSFVIKRVDTGVPQEFKKALAVQCAKTPEEIEDMRKSMAGLSEDQIAAAAQGPKDHCTGSTKGIKDVNMIFVIRHNSWYRCSQNFKCEPWDIRKIKDSSEGACGENGKGDVCRDGEFCYVHRITSKRSSYECVSGKQAFLLSDGDDVAKFSSPAFLPAPPTACWGHHPAPRQPKRRGRFL